jgi:hypothetical protein
VITWFSQRHRDAHKIHRAARMACFELSACRAAESKSPLRRKGRCSCRSDAPQTCVFETLLALLMYFSSSIVPCCREAPSRRASPPPMTILLHVLAAVGCSAGGLDKTTARLSCHLPHFYLCQRSVLIAGLLHSHPRQRASFTADAAAKGNQSSISSAPTHQSPAFDVKQKAVAHS